MPEGYRHSDTGGVPVNLDEDALTRFLANQCATRGVTTDAQWSTAIDNATDAQIILLLRAFLKRIVKVG